MGHPTVVEDGEGQKQIPFGNDNKKSKDKGNCYGKSRCLVGMTTRKATAKATTRAWTKAGAVRAVKLLGSLALHPCGVAAGVFGLVGGYGVVIAEGCAGRCGDV